MFICQLSIQKLPNFYSVVYFHILISEISQCFQFKFYQIFIFQHLVQMCGLSLYHCKSGIWRGIFNFDAPNLSLFSSFMSHAFRIMSKVFLPNLRSNIFSLMLSFSILYLLWATSNPKWWCCESAALNMPANLENSAMATRLIKFSFHSNTKEGQCQRMFKLPHNCTYFTT